LEFPEGVEPSARVGGLLVDILGAIAELLHVLMLPDFEWVDAIGFLCRRGRQSCGAMLVWQRGANPERAGRHAARAPVRHRPRGIDLRPSCRPPTGRCVGPTHSLRLLRDAKARSINGPSRRCRCEPGHLLLLVPPLRVRAQRTRIGTVPVQRMPMPVFLPHGRKVGTPDPEVVRGDGRG
jgi:hypothetical protein